MTTKQQYLSFYAPRAGAGRFSSCRGCRSVFLALASLWLLVGFVFAIPVYATPSSQDAETIEYLIDYVSQSDMIFVRNFGKHIPERAASHIRDKYNYFVDDIDSPEEFIELCASKSLVTGSEYRVVDPAGNKLKTRDWLMGALEKYRATQKQAASE
jgi:hypothetical protein